MGRLGLVSANVAKKPSAPKKENGCRRARAGRVSCRAEDMKAQVRALGRLVDEWLRAIDVRRLRVRRFAGCAEILRSCSRWHAVERRYHDRTQNPTQKTGTHTLIPSLGDLCSEN